jgi:hypothetical protein
MTRHPKSSDSSGSDLDRLFAPEPTRDPYAPPKLIFTQPDDRDVQQFADELTDFPQERVPEPVPVPPKVVPPVAAKRPARTKPRARRGEPNFWLFQGVAALVVAVLVLVVMLLPDGRRPETPDGAAAVRRLPPPETRFEEAPPAPVARLEAPPPAAQADSASRVAPPPAQAAPPPPLVTPPLQATRRAERAAPLSGNPNAGASPPPVVRASAAPAPPRPVDSPIAAAGAASPPETRVAEGPAATAPAAPVALPPAEAAPAVVASDRGRPPGVEAATPAVPIGTSGISSPDAGGAERERVRGLLSQYQRAYSDLDAAAAARVYPGVDRRALSRAFNTLSSQQIYLEDCRIDVLQARAQATCAGTASWTPKVGGGSQDQARRWHFDIKQVAGGDWQIAAVKVQ